MGLTASLTAEHEDGAVALRFTVANEGDRSVELTFGSAQTAEFVAADADGPVWRWSDGRMFAQRIREETLAAGESVVAEATWPDPPAGTYTVEATLAATDHRPTAETTVTV